MGSGRADGERSSPRLVCAHRESSVAAPVSDGSEVAGVDVVDDGESEARRGGRAAPSISM